MRLRSGAMLASVSLPDGVALERATAELTADSVPPGLLRAHHLAAGVWGRLRVIEGELTFVHEPTGESRRLTAGETQVIEPEVRHHIEPQPGVRFVIEFHR